MRKLLIMIAFASVMVLVACSDSSTDEKVSDVDNKEENQKLEDKQTDEEDNSSTTGDKDRVEDQENLKIGDTGTFDTTLGQYEMTLDRAELVDGELEGEKSTRDGYIILDITIKNTSDQTQDLEELIYSMEVISNLDHTGSQDHAHVYDTITAFEGDIEPGEKASAQFLTIVDDSEEYFFRKAVGNIAGGSSNQVIWSFSAEEAK